MLARISPVLVLSVSVAAYSQVAPTATGDIPVSDDGARMMAPAPVNGESYSTALGSEARSNYLNVGLTLTPAYSDNVVPGNAAQPIGELSYSISPSIVFDRATPRQHQTFTYSPGFNLYQRTSGLNSFGQTARLDWQYRLTARTSLSARNSLVQTSNVFDQSNVFSGTEISGSAPNSTAAVIAPFAEQINDNGTVQMSYQFSQNGMIGAGGKFSITDFPNPGQAVGLSNSRMSGGSGFYARRFSESQYVGVEYQYAKVLTFPSGAQSDVQMHSILPFYTVSPNSALSISLSAGVQHLSAVATSAPSSSAWSPSAGISVGWKLTNLAFAASYFRTTTAVQGLLGAFRTDNVSASENWRVSRTWSLLLGGQYVKSTNAISGFSSSNSGGSNVSGQASIHHAMGERLSIDFGYQRLHEAFSGIPVILNDPDSDREFISISYKLNRPVGQ